MSGMINVKILRETVCPKLKQVTEIGDSLGYNLTLKDSGKFLTSGRAVSIDGLGSCVGLRLETNSPIAQRKTFSAHIAPELEIVEGTCDYVSNIINDLRNSIRKSYEDVIAFLTGGTEQSRGLIDEIYRALSQENVHSTLVAGQKNEVLKNGLNSNRINSYFYKGDAIVYGDGIKKIKKDKDIPAEEIQDILDEHFDYVEISPYVPVEFVNSIPNICK